VSQNDPTDDALAAIASILERPVTPPDANAETTSDVVAEDRAQAALQPPSAAESEVPVAPATPELPEIDVGRYARVGPGPLDAIRFRWSARRDDSGNYYVDETIGPNSRPQITGPMPEDEVVAFIDARAREAQRRFEALKSELTIGDRATNHHDDGGEN
jgi:hypothetical protein